MAADKYLTGLNVIEYMKKNNLLAQDLAEKLKCSKQTVYTWRSNKSKPIRGIYGQKLKHLLDTHWEELYRNQLYDYIEKSAKGLVFWHFFRQAGVEKEVLIESNFQLLDCEEDISFKEIISNWNQESNPPRLILGPPGIGKSSFVRKAIISLLKEDQKVLPILIPLGLFPLYFNSVKEHKELNLKDFISFINNLLSILDGHAEKIIELLISGKAILFLDGIDEIPLELHDSFFEFFRKMLGKMGTLRKIFITSRPLGITLFTQLGFWNTYLIKRFSRKEISKLAENLLPSIQQRTFFSQLLTANPEIDRLASLPLTLSIILLMFGAGKPFVEFSEARVIEFLIDFTLGKYKGSRSLGGYIEREPNFAHLESPALIRTTLYFVCYKVRKRNPANSIIEKRYFSQLVSEIWKEKSWVPKEDIQYEFSTFIDYLKQLGIIEEPVKQESFIQEETLKFSYDILIDWLAGAYLHQNPKVLKKEIGDFIGTDMPIPRSTKQRIFFAFELMNAGYGDPDEVNSSLRQIFKSSESEENVVEKLLHIRFLFIVDALRRGLISEYDFKRKVRIKFRRLFEQNHYALLQKTYQSRITVLDPGPSRLHSPDEEYTNPFNLESYPRDWDTEKKNKWKKEVIKKRFNEAKHLNVIPNSVHLADFEKDISWRYYPSINTLLNEGKRIIEGNPKAKTKDEYLLRRFTFSARFVFIENETNDSIERLLRCLLEIVNAESEDIFKYMALDSFCFLRYRMKNIMKFIPNHRYGMIPWVELDKQYADLSPNHTYFRNKYCTKNNWEIEDIINDNDAKAHFMIIEHRDIFSKLIRKNLQSVHEKHLKILEDFSNQFSEDYSRSTIPNLESLEKHAKLCIYLPLIRIENSTKDRLINTLEKLTKTKNRQFWDVGPRQMYDYALFGLWLIHEAYNPHMSSLAF